MESVQAASGIAVKQTAAHTVTSSLGNSVTLRLMEDEQQVMIRCSISMPEYNDDEKADLYNWRLRAFGPWRYNAYKTPDRSSLAKADFQAFVTSLTEFVARLPSR